MRTRTWCVVAAAVGSAGLARAQVTNLFFEGSTDAGQTWHSSISAPPGSTLLVRLRVVLEGATALGLAGLTLQPTISHWDGAHTILPMTFPGLDNQGEATSETSYDGRHVRSTPVTNTGRMFPFGAVGQGAGSASGVLTAHIDPGNRLRFAGSNAASESDEMWGLVVAQMPPVLAGTNFNGSTSAIVFRYAMVLGSTPNWNLTEWGATALLQDQVRWYQNSTGLAVLDTPVQIFPARVTPPAPGGVALLAMGGVFAGRRRR